jgi:hypothetical protein
VLAGFPEIVGLNDGVAPEVVRVLSGQHLLHLEFRARAAGDDRPGPLLDGFVFFTPSLLPRVPRPPVPAAEGNQTEAAASIGSTESPRRDMVTAVTPLLSRLTMAISR